MVGGESDGALGDGETVEIVGHGCHHCGTEREIEMWCLATLNPSKGFPFTRRAGMP